MGIGYVWRSRRGGIKNDKVLGKIFHAPDLAKSGSANRAGGFEIYHQAVAGQDVHLAVKSRARAPAFDAIKLIRFKPDFAGSLPSVQEGDQGRAVNEKGAFLIDDRQAGLDPFPYGVFVNTEAGGQFFHGIG